jgi:hypothetical protein
LCGPLPGPAGEKDERVVRYRSNRGQHDDPQADLASAFRCTVFKDRQGSAVRVCGTIGARTGAKMVEGTSTGTTSAGRRGPQRQDKHEASKETAKARHGAPGSEQVRG